MSTTQIEPERIVHLNDRQPDADGRFVVYWMQASQRAVHNPALEHAIHLANDHEVPLVVAATVIADYPEASARHFSFMLGGLGRALRAVAARGATVRVVVGPPVEVMTTLSDGATVMVCDRGYLRHQRSWRNELAETLDIAVVQVEGDVVVPIDEVSDKQETAARTIRKKINSRRDDFLVELDTTALDHTSTPQGVRSDTDTDTDTDTDIALDDFDDIDALLARLGLDASDADEPEPVGWITPGTSAAQSLLDDFLDDISTYEDDRNRWTSDAGVSLMSPYLHYGQISPVSIALQVLDRAGDEAESYLEELIVRRELAVNYVQHCTDYDSWAGLPDWARTSLEQHADDDRDQTYTASELENGETNDAVWNQIMAEIRERGWVHNQLRMYWGKQIVRWTNTPQHAHRTLLELNNRWFLDGRDPNSFANVGWCFGLHDQGFKERDVSGKLRPFTTAALKRKDDLKGWLET